MLSRRSFFASSLLGIQATVARLAASADVAARPSEIWRLRYAERLEPAVAPAERQPPVNKLLATTHYFNASFTRAPIRPT
jgi:hypothetical protein